VTVAESAVDAVTKKVAVAGATGVWFVGWVPIVTTLYTVRVAAFVVVVFTAVALLRTQRYLLLLKAKSSSTVRVPVVSPLCPAREVIFVQVDPPFVDLCHWKVTVDASSAVPAAVNVALTPPPASIEALDG